MGANALRAPSEASSTGLFCRLRGSPALSWICHAPCRCSGGYWWDRVVQGLWPLGKGVPVHWHVHRAMVSEQRGRVLCGEARSAIIRLEERHAIPKQYRKGDCANGIKSTKHVKLLQANAKVRVVSGEGAVRFRTRWSPLGVLPGGGLLLCSVTRRRRQHQSCQTWMQRTRREQSGAAML